MNIYEDRSKYKIIFVLVALLIGSGSVYYTNYIVHRLAQREREQIQLYAKGLQYIVSQEEDESLNFFFQEVITANEIFPVILVTNSGNIISYRNINMPRDIADMDNNHPKKQQFLQDWIEIMKEEHPPVVINFGANELQYIYYTNSSLLSQLRYYPYIQLTVIAAFAFMAYMVFSYSRKAEQNQVWVGLAKETAHQLGTPLSSLMAWIEYFKSDPKFADDHVIPELEKDVERLEMITYRFSNIGSMPTLKYENIGEVVCSIINYLQKRISTKVKFTVHLSDIELPPVRINRNLFEWVIENICKNAVDAMSGVGEINITIKRSSASKNIAMNRGSAGKNKIVIDIADTGRGISKANINRVFDPGFSTKKRGWGLGLTLAKRIIENYHGGKIFVKQSEPNKGTTFRILLNIDNP